MFYFYVFIEIVRKVLREFSVGLTTLLSRYLRAGSKQLSPLQCNDILDCCLFCLSRIRIFHFNLKSTRPLLLFPCFTRFGEFGYEGFRYTPQYPQSGGRSTLIYRPYRISAGSAATKLLVYSCLYN